MPHLNESDIKGRITALESFWQPRNEKVINEREFLHLPQPKRVKKGFTSVVMNDPRTLFDTSVAMMSLLPPRFKIPTLTTEEKDQPSQNKAERFSAGVYHEVDEATFDAGGDGWIRELAYYILGGLYAVFPWIDTEEDGDTPIFRWDIYDPITTYPMWSGGKLTEFARVYYTNTEAARNMADSLGFKKPDNLGGRTEADNVRISSYWWKEKEKVFNTLFIADTMAKKITHEEQFTDGIPILTGVVGGFPSRSAGANDRQWMSRMFRSIIENNRGMYEQKNRWISLMMQIVQDVAYKTIVEFTRTGQAKTKPGDFGSGALLHRQVGEPITTLDHAATPVEVNSILTLINSSIARGGIPDAALGTIPFETSGFALAQLISAVKYKLSPYAQVLDKVIARCALQTMKLYREGEYKPIQLTFMDAKGNNFLEDFDPDKDIPDAKFMEVDVPFSLPLDKIQSIAAARQAMTPPQILSRETIWEDFDMGVDDKDLEYERILNDQMMEDPVMQLIGRIERLNDTADKWDNLNKPDRAIAIRGYASKLEQQLETVISQTERQTQEPKPKAPAGGGGVSPERVEGTSRAQTRAALGARPPGVVRRPLAPGEERPTGGA